MEKPYHRVSRIKGVAMLLAALPFYVLILTGLACAPDGTSRPGVLILGSLVLVYLVQVVTSTILAASIGNEQPWFRWCAILAALVSVLVMVGQLLPVGWFFAPYVWMPLVGILTAVGGLVADDWWLVLGGAAALIITPVSAFFGFGLHAVPVASAIFGLVWLFTGRHIPVSERIPRI